MKGKFGFYCKGKCGMNMAKVYGVEISDTQVKGLLDGKSTSYKSAAKKMIQYTSPIVPIVTTLVSETVFPKEISIPIPSSSFQVQL